MNGRDPSTVFHTTTRSRVVSTVLICRNPDILEIYDIGPTNLISFRALMFSWSVCSCRKKEYYSIKETLTITDRKEIPVEIQKFSCTTALKNTTLLVFTCLHVRSYCVFSWRKNHFNCPRPPKPEWPLNESEITAQNFVACSALQATFVSANEFYSINKHNRKQLTTGKRMA